MDTKELFKSTDFMLKNASIFWGEIERGQAALVGAQLAQDMATLAIAQELARAFCPGLELAKTHQSEEQK